MSERKLRGWKDSLYVTIYRLAKGGSTDHQIAQQLGITDSTLTRWKSKLPALAEALKEARTGDPYHRNGQEPQTFKQYVLSKLPPELIPVWNRLVELDRSPNGIRQIEALLEEQGKVARQHLFLYALMTSNFNLTRACRIVNIKKVTYDRWIATDPDFAAMVSEVQWLKKSFFENAFIRLVEAGEPSAILFAMKTYARDLGYQEKTVIEHTGAVDHMHQVASVEQLDALPLETRLQLLQALRQANPSQVVDALPARGDSYADDD